MPTLSNLLRLIAICSIIWTKMIEKHKKGILSWDTRTQQAQRWKYEKKLVDSNVQLWLWNVFFIIWRKVTKMKRQRKADEKSFFLQTKATENDNLQSKEKANGLIQVVI